MEDVSFYASETDIVDELNNEQVKELDEASNKQIMGNQSHWTSLKRK